jgi:leucyl aminopeptidase
MPTTFQLLPKINDKLSIAILAGKKTKLNAYLGDNEIKYLEKRIAADEKFILINQLTRLVMVLIDDADKNAEKRIEKFRVAGNKVCVAVNTHKYGEVILVDELNDKRALLAVAEGVALSNYQFLKYRKEAVKETFSLKKILVHNKPVNQAELDVLQTMTEATFIARDLVNEPQSFLNAPQFSEEIVRIGKLGGFKVEVLTKSKIEALKMGGLLAVNMGSQQPPTFNILEWKPKNAKNKQPLILVGKGVVYDTGGLSLKPTANSMDYMKCDMAGGAAVVAALYAVSKSKTPYHVIGLIPATDNRPGENAYCPGDVITMYNGMTVEMLNADAEGRMILGDALAYAQKYKPGLVIDLATLTGAAAAAIGQYGIVCMGTADEPTKNELKMSGFNTHERLVEFPFWDEYKNLLKSDIADFKNIGGAVAGAITAGKFLEYFTDYPWIHLDIAGPAFINAADSYRGKNGTGVGVRLLFDFIRNKAAK